MKEYLLTAGPDARSRARAAGHGAADALPPGARLHRVPARGPGRPAVAVPDQAAAARARGLGHRGHGGGGLQLPAHRATRRSSSAAASSASAGGTSARPTASSACSSTSSGARASTPSRSPRRSRRTPASAPSTRPPARPRPRPSTTSRRSPRWSRERDDVILCVDAHHGDRRLRRAGRQVGARRGGGRLAEGAHAAARAGDRGRVSDKAWKAQRARQPAALLPRIWCASGRAQDKGETAFTPAVSLIVGLRESLRMLKEETLRRRLQPPRAAGQGDARRVGRRWGSSSSRRRPTNAVTAFRVPERHRRHGDHQADARRATASPSPAGRIT